MLDKTSENESQATFADTTGVASPAQSKFNLPLALAAGVTTSVICAWIWAFITFSTGYQIGYMAVGLGFAVGFMVRFTGRGSAMPFGITGAVCALLGCLLGNFFSIVTFIAQEESMEIIAVLQQLDYAFVPELMASTFHAMDLLFYAIATWAGFKYSFAPVPLEEDPSEV